ncbi:glycosyltransferase [Dermabacteraceae bacterium P13128]
MVLNRRVLWLSPVAEVGGVSRHIIDAASQGIPGWNIEVAAPAGPLLDTLSEAGVPVHPVASAPGSGIRASVASVRALLAREDFALLHSHLAYADLVALLAAGRTPIVSTEHGIAADARLYNASAVTAQAKRLVHRLRVARTSRVIAVSESTAQQVARQWGGRKKIRVVLNGVDPLVPEPKPQAGLCFLSLSRLSHEKRIDKLLEAFALVHKRHPEATLTVAGDGPLRAQLESKARELGVAEAVSFPGTVVAADAYRTHDVVVQLSAWENLSYTLLDAVKNNKGIVATPVGGNGEIVRAVSLVEAEDTNQVARVMLTQALETEARTPAAAWDWSVSDMCAELANVYAEVSACKA